MPFTQSELANRVTVFIRALDVENFGGGVFAVALPGRELTTEEREVLKGLFPRLIEQAHELLAREALLDSLLDSTIVPMENPVKVPEVPGHAPGYRPRSKPKPNDAEKASC